MRTARDFGVYVGEVVLLLALELSAKTWRLAFVANGRRRQVTVAPGDAAGFERAVAEATAKLGLPVGTAVVSCYEAGRDGFWVHRWLEQRGVRNAVIDSSSIEVNRRLRRAKTDRIDAEKLASLLHRWYFLGETESFRVVRVPSVEEEDQRVLHRERDSWVQMRTRIGNRIDGLLAAHGVRVAGAVAVWRDRLDALRTGDGRPLPPQLMARLERLTAHYVELSATIRALEVEQRAQIEDAAGRGGHALMELLMTLKGVGLQTSWLLVAEFFGWRRFVNRRELAACAGLTPTPYDSGDTRREQGISKSGSRRVRTALIELAWGWLRYQPDSALSRWWRERFSAGTRGRKVGIVALARKLLIALWHMTQTGEVPEGAMLKPVR